MASMQERMENVKLWVSAAQKEGWRREESDGCARERRADLSGHVGADSKGHSSDGEGDDEALSQGTTRHAIEDTTAKTSSNDIHQQCPGLDIQARHDKEVERLEKQNEKVTADAEKWIQRLEASNERLQKQNEKVSTDSERRIQKVMADSERRIQKVTADAERRIQKVKADAERRIQKLEAQLEASHRIVLGFMLLVMILGSLLVASLLCLCANNFQEAMHATSKNFEQAMGVIQDTPVQKVIDFVRDLCKVAHMSAKG